MLRENKLINLVEYNYSWLKSNRGNLGYQGPSFHYWKTGFDYTGVGLDWRYEGIIDGLLNLYKKTKDKYWLIQSALTALDPVKLQLKNGCFIHSSFEGNPNENGGGVPHEASIDAVLIRVAKILNIRCSYTVYV